MYLECALACILLANAEPCQITLRCIQMNEGGAAFMRHAELKMI